MAYVRPWSLDFLVRITKLARASGHVAISMFDAEAGDYKLFYVETGAVIGNGSQAATGLGHTVLTHGHIAFGHGRFLASHSDNVTISKGILNDAGDLAWTETHSAAGEQIRAISYCGGYFFVTSRSFGDDATTHHVERLRIDGDGDHWAAETFMDGADDCGTVAYETRKKIYCCVGLKSITDPAFEPFPTYQAVCSATSTNGTIWTDAGSVNPYSTGFPAPVVAAGNGGFVTGGYLKGSGTLGGAAIGTAQAQANVSLTGSDWTPADLPVPGGEVNAGSFGVAAAFVDVGADGYFIAAATGSGSGVPAIMALRSTDGMNWTLVRQWGDAATGPAYNGLCVVGSNLGTIATFSE